MKIKFSTIVSFTLIVIVLLVANIACQKTTAASATTTPCPTVQPNSIIGLWTGTYTLDGGSVPGEPFYSLIFKPNGEIINDTKGANVQYLSVGNWVRTGNNFEINVSIVAGNPSLLNMRQIQSLTWDSAGNRITNGRWRNFTSSPINSSGIFTITKEQ